jgi:septal ring factor EnvC (AmiA/AmiB activator)
LAEETKRRGKELEQQLQRENGHGNDQIQRLIEESHRAIHAVNQRLDQLQRELQEMREQFNRVRNQR